jgi:hypothetical protein
MPRRSNEFQQLVLLLQMQIAESGTVQESAMLTDVLTGGQAEVDIVVRTVMHGVPMTLAFECTSESRPATIEWVREMIGKHQTLPIDKTILVSRSGFTKEARLRAEAENVLPLSLEDASEADWLEFVKGLSNLRLGSFTFHPTSGQLDLVGPPVAGVADSTPIRLGNGTQTTLIHYIRAILTRDDLVRQVMRKWVSTPDADRKSPFTITVTLTPEAGAAAQVDGEWREIARCMFKVEVKINSVPLSLTPAALQGHDVAFATAPNIFPDHNPTSPYVLVNIVGGEAGILRAGLLFPKSDTGVPEIHHMKLEVHANEESA